MDMLNFFELAAEYTHYSKELRDLMSNHIPSAIPASMSECCKERKKRVFY